MSRVIRLESERDRLEQELTKAQARIRALEEDRDQVVNRIDWVIDSLRNLLENER
jgi:sugar-specific transcriptional regulator TrmB